MSKSAPKPRIALTVSGGRCNVGMPNNVFDRFVWAVRLYAQAGFKVVIDNHGGWRGAARVCIGRGGRRGESIRQGGVGAGGGGGQGGVGGKSNGESASESPRGEWSGWWMVQGSRW